MMENRDAPRRARASLAVLMAVAVFIPFVATGCKRLYVSDRPVVNTNAFQDQPPRTIAVLPFLNSSDVEKAGPEARNAFSAALRNLDYVDVEQSKVDATLAQLAVDHNLSPQELPPTLIRDSNLADAALVGEVIGVSKLWFLMYSQIKIWVRLELLDLRTQQTLYENRVRGINAHFAPPLGILDVVTSSFRTLWSLRDSEVQETLQELAERVIQEFPNRPAAFGQGQIQIRDVRLLLPRNPLRAGDALGLVFSSAPGQKAFFDLGGIARDIPMAEMSPGRYGVRYAIQPGQSAAYCVVTCKVIGQGQVVKATLYHQPFAVEGN